MLIYTVNIYELVLCCILLLGGSSSLTYTIRMFIPIIIYSVFNFFNTQ